MSKHVSEYSQQLLDHSKPSGATKVVTDKFETASKRAIKKATSNLTGNKIAVLSKSVAPMHTENTTNNKKVTNYSWTWLM